MPPSTPPLLNPAWLAVLLVLATAVSWYVAVTAAAGVFRSRASSLIVAGGLPALAGAIWFTVIGRTGAALALLLGTAMATATLVAGIVTNADPVAGRRVMDDPGQRLQVVLLPVAVILLVAGFSGRLTILHACVLLTAGAIVGWLGYGLRQEVPTANLAAASGDESPAQDRPWIPWVQLALAAGLSIVGAGLAAGAAEAAGRRRGELLDFELAMLVAWVLALPLIGLGTKLAAAGNGPVAQRGLVLLAAYLICLAVPAVIFLDVALQAIARGGAGWWNVLASPPSVVMPLRLWRGDSVMLCVAGLLILPAALGRWRMGRLEGGALIGLYVVYVALALWSRR